MENQTQPHRKKKKKKKKEKKKKKKKSRPGRRKEGRGVERGGWRILRNLGDPKEKRETSARSSGERRLRRDDSKKCSDQQNIGWDLLDATRPFPSLKVAAHFNRKADFH